MEADMKILTKALLITASALSAGGIVLSAVGGMMGGNIAGAFANLPVRVETKGEIRTQPGRSGGGSDRSNGGNDRSSRSYGSGGSDSGNGSDIDEFYRDFFGDDFDIFGDFFGDGNGGGGRSNLEYF